MAKYTTFIIIIALRVFYQPSPNQPETSPFASPSHLPASTISFVPAKLINVNGSISNHKVILNWVVGENETADQFEVEKSSDGKIFTLTALVFGTDKPETDKYQFYEKAANQKILYRIKLINKNRSTEYSEVIEINPAV
jgi:hypothetical protein